MGKTICLIKPEAFEKRKDVKGMITENDFSIDEDKEQPWKRRQIEMTYSMHKLHYPTPHANSVMQGVIARLILERFSDPMVDALIISSKGDTIEDFVKLCGPTKALEYTKKEFENTLRGRFGLGPEQTYITTIDGYKCKFDFNAVHKASSEEELEIEKSIYF